MSDKSRQEFVEGWAKAIVFRAIRTRDCDDKRDISTEEKVIFADHQLAEMLLEYDKLKSDKLAWLKESVKADFENFDLISGDDFCDGIRTEALSILTEITRLEKEKINE